MLLMISNIRQFRYNRELLGCLGRLAVKGKHWQSFICVMKGLPSGDQLPWCSRIIRSGPQAASRRLFAQCSPPTPEKASTLSFVYPY